MAVKTCTLGVAIKDYFGLSAHETLAEMKTLDQHDREYLTRELTTVGYDIQTKAAA